MVDATLISCVVSLITAGVAIFGPALKDQKQQKLEHTNNADDSAIDSSRPNSKDENIISLSTDSATVSSEPALASPTGVSPCFFPKFQDWKTFWMEGDRALKKERTSATISSDSPGDTMTTSDSPKP